MKKINICLLSLLFVIVLGCQSFTGFDFDSDAIVGGGAVAGKDYITGLKPSVKAREYFVKSNANAAQKKTVTPGDDQGTGVVWTDDGGIVIPPGCSIEFENKGYCLDPHLPAPGAGHEMQFVRTASLIPEELQGTYRNLLKRSAAGDEDVKNNMQRLVWALRTAGSQDVMATHLTERQREILSECAEDGSFEDFVYRQELYGKIVEGLKSKFINKIKSSTSVRVGNVVYDAFDLLDPDKGKQKVEAHLQSLISMGLNLPVTQTGFNYGELENGIFTDIKGTGTLSFKAKIANSTSQPYTFYPMNYAAQVGSGGSSVGFYAAANSGMCQRGTCSVPEKVERSLFYWFNGNLKFKYDLNREEQLKLYRFGQLANSAYRDRSEVPDGYRVFSFSDLSKLGIDFDNYSISQDFNGYIEDKTWNSMLAVRGISFGFGARLLIDEQTDDIVVSYRGSNRPDKDITDWIDNFNQGFGGLPTQYKMAEELLNAVCNAFPDRKIIVTGHSLGGALASWATLNNSYNNVECYTYNAAGLSPENLFTGDIQQRAEAENKIVNVRNKRDPVTSIPATNHIGPMYEVENSRTITSHSMDNLLTDMRREITGTELNWFWGLFTW